MTATRRIAPHRPPRVKRTRVAQGRRARARALGAAMLGAGTGLALGVVILIGAPVVGVAPGSDDARLDRPAVPAPRRAAMSVAWAIAPARGAESASGRDGEEDGP